MKLKKLKGKKDSLLNIKRPVLRGPFEYRKVSFVSVYELT